MERYRPANEPERLVRGRSAIPVFLNVEAGRGGERVRRRVTEALERAGAVADPCFVAPERLATAVRRAADAGARVVAVAGGDGTLSTAAEALLGRSTALAPVPTGTLNHFARRLGILNIDAAARALAGGAIVPVTVGFANERLFLNTVSVGVYAGLVRHRERLRRWLTKWPAAVVAAVAVLARLPVIDVGLEIDGERRRRQTPLIWIGAGRGSVPFSHRARPASEPRVLEIALVRGPSRLHAVGVVLRVLARLLYGRPAADGGALELLRAQALVLHAERRLDGTVDGEVKTFDPPLRLGVQELPLRVLVPPEAAARDRR